MGTAVVKGAARGEGRRDWGRRPPGGYALFPPMVPLGDRGEKGLGIGVHGGVVDIFGIPQLHDAAQIHDADPIADVADHIEVVRDKEVRELQVFLKSHEQIENLGLDGDIQGGYRARRPRRSGAW